LEFTKVPQASLLLLGGWITAQSWGMLSLIRPNADYYRWINSYMAKNNSEENSIPDVCASFSYTQCFYTTHTMKIWAYLLLLIN
jgi:hypothetical protein